MSTFLEIPSFVFSLVGKFSAAFLIFSGLVLFVPESVAKSMVIDIFRAENGTVLWLIFLLSFSMFTSYIGKEIWAAIFPWLQKKVESKRRLSLMIERLDSLSEREALWFSYCLYYKRQTMGAPLTAQPPSALRAKGLIVAGEGHPLEIPFTIPDGLWKYLQTIKIRFLPDFKNDRERQAYERKLSEYCRSLQPY